MQVERRRLAYDAMRMRGEGEQEGDVGMGGRREEEEEWAG